MFTGPFCALHPDNIPFSSRQEKEGGMWQSCKGRGRAGRGHRGPGAAERSWIGGAAYRGTNPLHVPPATAECLGEGEEEKWVLSSCRMNMEGIGSSVCRLPVQVYSGAIQAS